jgi:hypothetical protein
LRVRNIASLFANQPPELSSLVLTLSGFLLFNEVMYQTIHEQITVAGVYKSHTFTPRKFLWRKKPYLITEITLKADTKDGGVIKRLYSVVVKGNVYRLEFNRDNENWWLEEVWCE